MADDKTAQLTGLNQKTKWIVCCEPNGKTVPSGPLMLWGFVEGGAEPKWGLYPAPFAGNCTHFSPSALSAVD
jgi:hypothetical protein